MHTMTRIKKNENWSIHIRNKQFDKWKLLRLVWSKLRNSIDSWPEGLWSQGALWKRSHHRQMIKWKVFPTEFSFEFFSEEWLLLSL
jgi:hypothetical protein